MKNTRLTSVSEFVSRGCILLALLCSFLPQVRVEASTNSNWFARHWETEDGLPNNNVNSLAQTPDGFLWLGTPIGLTRFDGVAFEEISLTNFVDRGNRGVAALVQNRSGGLCLQMDRGAIVGLNLDTITAMMPTNGLFDSAARSMVEADDGTLWVSYVGGAICFFKDGKATAVTQQLGLPLSPDSSVAKDSKGRIWLARNGQVGIFQDGRFQSRIRPGTRSISLAADRTGGIWICAGAQLFHLSETALLKKVGELPTVNPAIEPSVIFEDHCGAVWVGTAFDGLFRFDGTQFERIPTSHPAISSLLEDNEGNIWVGTHGGGLNRLRRRAITLENSQNGLPFEAVQSVCQDTNETFWAVTENGCVVRRDASGWESVSTNAGMSGYIATCVAPAPDGSVWIGTRNNCLVHLQGGQVETWNESCGLRVPRISALMVSSNGDLWIGGFNHALQFLHAGHFTNMPLQQNAHSIRAITQGASGTVWIGTSRGLLLRIDGTNVVDETEKDSPVVKSIRSLSIASDGSLWIGYAGFGVGRLKSGRFSQVTTAQGLFDDYISQIVLDGNGWLWFGADRGIFKVREQELIHASENPTARVRSIHYGRGEGLPSLEASFEFAPGAMRSSDGRIWIPTQSGLAVINPQSPDRNSKPPPVFLQSVSVDGKIVAARGGPLPLQGVSDLRQTAAFEFPPNHRNIQFRFTALNFSAPENLRLQYRLDGFDNDWIEAPRERNASFTRLPAGHYHFRVRASNSEDIWNESALAFTFTVTPFLWQKWWFQSVTVVSFAVMMIVAVRYISFRRLRSRLLVLEQQAALDKERARIARDLHDDLGSHLTKIVLMSDLMIDYRKNPDKSAETAQRVSSTARQVIKTLDETVWAVNPRNDTLPHLIDYIGQFAVEFLHTAGIRCHMDMPMQVPERSVSTEVRHNLFLVVKESLNNVVNHARATEAWIQVTVTDRAINLNIEDNGRGFDHAPKNGHADGLRNMRQRIEEIGGKFDLQSRPAAGTRIHISTPLNK